MIFDTNATEIKYNIIFNIYVQNYYKTIVQYEIKVNPNSKD